MGWVKITLRQRININTPILDHLIDLRKGQHLINHAFDLRVPGLQSLCQTWTDVYDLGLFTIFLF